MLVLGVRVRANNGSMSVTWLALRLGFRVRFKVRLRLSGQKQ